MGAEIGGAFGGEKDTSGGRDSGSDASKSHTIADPANVDEQTTSLLIGAGDHLTVDAAGNFSIALGTD